MPVPSDDVGSAEVLISVVIPCYNAAQFIDATLDSVLGQTHFNLEVIVVDDKSTDNSVALVKKRSGADVRIRLIELDRNTGAPAAPRNVGIRAARGRWIALLDADDLWHPRKLEFQLRALQQHKARMCSTAMLDLAVDVPVRFKDPTDPEIERVTLGKQLFKYRTPTSSIVVDRDLLLEIPFNEDLQFKAREDTDCFIRAHEYMLYSIKLRHPFVLYRLQEDQISGNKIKMVRRHLNMLKKYRLRSGEALGLKAYWFTATHFATSLYYRALRRAL